MMKITGHIVDVINQKIFDGEVVIGNGRIISIHPTDQVDDHFILPGFIDAHVHIESSMLVPSEFARVAVMHGTVATVSDPHEIANVVGVEGIEFMIANGKQVPFKFNFGIPSCVPATSFETAGATVGLTDVTALLKRQEIKYLAEMMNWPGVLNRDPDVMSKVNATLAAGKVVDGHAPGLKGELAVNYASAGITTDHECFTEEEALDKLRAGMKILIREGSAAKNFNALIGLSHDHYKSMMFCSDDKHPDDLLEGHINQLVVRALRVGVDLFKVLRMACVNPVLHYGLDVGLLREGDDADFIIVRDLSTFSVLQTYVRGHLVASEGTTKINGVSPAIINRFATKRKSELDFTIAATSEKVRVIEVIERQLVTNEIFTKIPIRNGLACADEANDILKIAVVNRYADAKPAVGFVKNIGLKSGAIASCVGHDSHNIVVVGVDDASIARAVNLIIDHQGGISAVNGADEEILPLPIAGIMSDQDAWQVAGEYQKIDQFAKKLGTPLISPFMTLSFLALLVIPSLKLSDKGLFDGNRFSFTSLFVEE